jgi:Fur family transcriptional regulator, ferric uptake regulator
LVPDTDHHRELFLKHGLRITRLRETLYSLLAHSTAHPTAEELHELARAGDPEISLATVYNTLDALQEAGLCRRLQPSTGGDTRFQAYLRDHAHVMTPDGRIFDVPDEINRVVFERLTRELPDEVGRRLGMPIESMSIQFLARRDHPVG